MSASNATTGAGSDDGGGLDVDLGVVFEVAAPIASLAILLAYKVWFNRQTDPSATRLMVGSVRFQWVKKNLNSGMLPVNTLRDEMRSAVFFASSVLLVAVAAVGFTMSVFPNCLGDVAAMQRDECAVPCTTQVWLVMAKVWLLALMFAFSFVNFSLAVRHIQHTMYFMNAGLAGPGVDVTPELAFRYMKRFTSHRQLGLRCIWYSSPIMLWIFHPVALLVGSVLLVFGLWHVDHVNVHEVLPARAVNQLSRKFVHLGAPTSDDGGRGGGSGSGGPDDDVGSGESGGGGGGGAAASAASATADAAAMAKVDSLDAAHVTVDVAAVGTAGESQRALAERGEAKKAR